MGLIRKVIGVKWYRLFYKNSEEVESLIIFGLTGCHSGAACCLQNLSLDLSSTSSPSLEIFGNCDPINSQISMGRQRWGERKQNADYSRCRHRRGARVRFFFAFIRDSEEKLL